MRLLPSVAVLLTDTRSRVRDIAIDSCVILLNASANCRDQSLAAFGTGVCVGMQAPQHVSPAESAELCGQLPGMITIV